MDRDNDEMNGKKKRKGKFKMHFIDNDTEMKQVCPFDNELS